MKWFLLHDRRHLGPYSIEELQVDLQKGLIKPSDFVLSIENERLQNIKYVTLESVLTSTDVVLEDRIQQTQIEISAESDSESSEWKEEITRAFEVKVSDVDLVTDRAKEAPKGNISIETPKPSKNQVDEGWLSSIFGSSGDGSSKWLYAVGGLGLLLVVFSVFSSLIQFAPEGQKVSSFESESENIDRSPAMGSLRPQVNQRAVPATRERNAQSLALPQRRAPEAMAVERRQNLVPKREEEVIERIPTSDPEPLDEASSDSEEGDSEEVEESPRPKKRSKMNKKKRRVAQEEEETDENYSDEEVNDEPDADEDPDNVEEDTGEDY